MPIGVLSSYVQFCICKDTAKIRDNKKNRHLFYIIPLFFLRNQNIHRIFAERNRRKMDCA